MHHGHGKMEDGRTGKFIIINHQSASCCHFTSTTASTATEVAICACKSPTCKFTPCPSSSLLHYCRAAFSHTAVSNMPSISRSTVKVSQEEREVEVGASRILQEEGSDATSSTSTSENVDEHNDFFIPSSTATAISSSKSDDLQAHPSGSQSLHHRSRIKSEEEAAAHHRSKNVQAICSFGERRRSTSSRRSSSSSSASTSTSTSTSSSSPSRFLLTFLSSCHLVQVTSRLVVALAMTSLFLILAHVMPGAYCSTSTISASATYSSSSGVATAAAATLTSTKRAYFNQTLLQQQLPAAASITTYHETKPNYNHHNNYNSNQNINHNYKMFQPLSSSSSSSSASSTSLLASSSELTSSLDGNGAQANNLHQRNWLKTRWPITANTLSSSAAFTNNEDDDDNDDKNEKGNLVNVNEVNKKAGGESGGNVNNKLYSNQLIDYVDNQQSLSNNNYNNGNNKSAKIDLTIRSVNNINVEQKSSIIEDKANNNNNNYDYYNNNGNNNNNNNNNNVNNININRSNYIYYDTLVNIETTAVSSSSSSSSDGANSGIISQNQSFPLFKQLTNYNDNNNINKNKSAVNNNRKSDYNNTQQQQEQEPTMNRGIYEDNQNSDFIEITDNDNDNENENENDQEANKKMASTSTSTSTTKLSIISQTQTQNQQTQTINGNNNGTTKAERDSVVNVSSTGVRPTMAFTNSYFGHGRQRGRQDMTVDNEPEAEADLYGNRDDEMMQSDQSLHLKDLSEDEDEEGENESDGETGDKQEDWRHVSKRPSLTTITENFPNHHQSRPTTNWINHEHHEKFLEPGKNPASSADPNNKPNDPISASATTTTLASGSGKALDLEATAAGGGSSSSSSRKSPFESYALVYSSPASLSQGGGGGAGISLKSINSNNTPNTVNVNSQHFLKSSASSSSATFQYQDQEDTKNGDGVLVGVRASSPSKTSSHHYHHHHDHDHDKDHDHLQQHHHQQQLHQQQLLQEERYKTPVDFATENELLTFPTDDYADQVIVDDEVVEMEVEALKTSAASYFNEKSETTAHLHHHHHQQQESNVVPTANFPGFLLTTNSNNEDDVRVDVNNVNNDETQEKNQALSPTSPIIVAVSVSSGKERIENLQEDDDEQMQGDDPVKNESFSQASSAAATTASTFSNNNYHNNNKGKQRSALQIRRDLSRLVASQNGRLNGVNGLSSVIGADEEPMPNKCDRLFMSSDSNPNGTFESPTMISEEGHLYQCIFMFVAKPMERVEVVFTQFTVRGTPPECVHEWVDIWTEVEGTDPTDLVTTPFSGRYCGKIPPRKRISLYGGIAIGFYSDKNSTDETIFRGTYSFINDSRYQIGTPVPRTLCSYTIMGASKRNGDLISPTYPGVYPKNLSCSYKFIGIEGQRIRLEFRDFDVFYGGAHCPFDEVKVYDGMDPTASLIGTYCGQQRNLVVFSSTHLMLVTFTTLDRSTEAQNRGFKGVWEFSESFVKLDFIEKNMGTHIRGTECDQRILSKGQSAGVVYSPNYPFPYVPKIVCRYFIYGLQDPQHLERVRLSFEKFDVITNINSEEDTTNQSEPKKCGDGFLKVYLKGQEVIQAYDKADYEFCGKDVPHDVVSDGPRLVLVFSSGEAVGSGFKARYQFETEYRVPGTAAPDGSCHFTYYGASRPKGEFNSPRFPSNYPSMTNCTYIFFQQPNEQVRIVFDNFKMRSDKFNYTDRGAYGDLCEEDWVEIWNVIVDEDDRLIGRYCGSTAPGPIESLEKASALKLILHTDDEGVSSGFKARYIFFNAKTIFGECGQNITQAQSGVLTSPKWPGKYDGPQKGEGSATCNWFLSVRPGSRVMLHFQNFAIEGEPNGRGCPAAAVRIWVDPDGVPVELCGESLVLENSQYVSTRNLMRVTFITADKAVGAPGFRAVWTEVQEVPRISSGAPCHHSYFRCVKSLFCIPAELRCDGVDNCGTTEGEIDMSDEELCGLEFGDMNTLIAIVIGIAISLFFIVLLCAWGQRRKRRRRRRLQLRRPPIHVCDNAGARFAAMDSV